jgi:hypothetical protein
VTLPFEGCFRFAGHPECGNQDRAEATLVSVVWHSTRSMWATSLIEPDAVLQVGKTRVLAHGVKDRIYLQVL